MAAPLVVTLGDPAGIGPEVTERALRAWHPAHPGEAVILSGPANVVQVMQSRLPFATTALTQADFAGPMGQASAASGHASLAALQAAIDLASRGGAGAIVTAPISKEALALAGSADRGHTEILARSLAQGPTAMAFFTPRLRVVLATVHIPLRAVFAQLTAARVADVAKLLHDSLVQHEGIAQPRLALAGLNPHAGENGLMGDDEQKILQPAVTLARAAGVLLSEPVSADTVFRRAIDGEYDAVVALYHDQGLIPIKLLAFGEAVNVTLGLRVPRTSPDHGTAYGLVGKNQAHPDGMLAALHMGLRLRGPLPTAHEALS